MDKKQYRYSISYRLWGDTPEKPLKGWHIDTEETDTITVLQKFNTEIENAQIIGLLVVEL